MKIFFRLLKMLGLFAVSVSPSVAQKVEGSWITFQRETAGLPVFVRMLLGQEDYLSKTKAAIYVVTIPFKDFDDLGFPTDAEYERFFMLDETIHHMEDTNDFQVVGITTAQKQRQIFVLAAESGSALTPLRNAVEQAGYSPIFVREADGLAIYKDKLHPTESEIGIAADINVLDELRKNGDRAEVVRHVDHYAYFSTMGDAERFSDWLKKGNYMSIEIRHGATGDSILVFFQHFGTVVASELIAIATVLREAAIGFGGRYDGWETAVMR